MVKLNWTLSKNDPDETIAQVGNIRLHRKDFWTLGLNAELEATVSGHTVIEKIKQNLTTTDCKHSLIFFFIQIANACLEVIVMVAKEKVCFSRATNY